jgi:pimeloyl-ACP methyl ester carboxylesterase
MKDNFGPAMNRYRAFILGLNLEDEKSALASGEMDGKLHMPVFMLCASRDPLASVTKAAEGMSKVAEDLKVETLPTGHWVHLEEAEKVNAFLEEFVVGTEGRSEEGKL